MVDLVDLSVGCVVVVVVVVWDFFKIFMISDLIVPCGSLGLDVVVVGLVLVKRPTLSCRDLGVEALKEVSYKSGLLVKIVSVLPMIGLLASSTVFFINMSFSFCNASLFLSSSLDLNDSNDHGMASLDLTVSWDFSVETGKCLNLD